jgi:hypothetical protein
MVVKPILVDNLVWVATRKDVLGVKAVLVITLVEVWVDNVHRVFVLCSVVDNVRVEGVKTVIASVVVRSIVLVVVEIIV